MAYFIYHEANNNEPAHLEYQTGGQEDDLNTRANIVRWVVDQWAVDQELRPVREKYGTSTKEVSLTEAQISHALNSDVPLTNEMANEVTRTGEYYPTTDNIIGAPIMNSLGIAIQEFDPQGRALPEGCDFNYYWNIVKNDHVISAAETLSTKPNWIGTQAQPIDDDEPTLSNGALFEGRIGKGPFKNLSFHTSLGTIDSDGQYKPELTILDSSHPVVKNVPNQ